MAEEKNGNKTGLTMIVGLFAVIAGVYAMMEPMGQRIDFLSTELKTAMSRLDNIADLEREDHAKIMTFDVRLSRLEKDTDNSQAWMNNHDLRVRGLNSAQWERIKSLEREVYGYPMPVAIGEASGAKPN